MTHTFGRVYPISQHSRNKSKKRNRKINYQNREAKDPTRDN